MDVVTCLRRARACRSFAAVDVSDDDIESLIGGAGEAGSGHNRQPWTFIALRDRDRIDTLASLGKYTTPLRRAPVGLVLAMDRNESERRAEMNLFDCGRAAQNLQLAAVERGLGIVPQGIRDRAAAAELLELPPSKRVLIAFAVGHPADDPDETIEGVPKEEELESLGRKAVDDVLHWERHR